MAPNTKTAFYGGPKYITGRQWRAKLTLRICAFFFGSLALIFSIWLALINFQVAFDRVAPVAIASIVWCAIEGVLLCVLSKHRGTHPGICFGVDLIIILAYITMEVFVGLGFRELNPSKDDPHYQIVKQLVISVLAFGSAAISAHIWLAYITVREIWALYAQKTLPTTGNLKTGDVP